MADSQHPEIDDDPNSRSSPLWLINIREDDDRGTGNIQGQRGLKIPKLEPDTKAASKNGERDPSYAPSMVSIGPYHLWGRESLKMNHCESLKMKMVCRFLRKTKVDTKITKEALYEAVAKMAKNVRGFYDASFSDVSSENYINDEDFTKMMFIDGCFVIEFIYCVTNHKLDKQMSDQQVALMKRDLLLLENQLPYPVLETLMSVRFKKHKEKKFGEKYVMEKLKMENSDEKDTIIDDVLHIDDFLKIRRPETAVSWFFRLLVNVLVCIFFCSCCCCCFCCGWLQGKERKDGKGDDLRPSDHLPSQNKKEDGTGDDPQPAHLPPTPAEKEKDGNAGHNQQSANLRQPLLPKEKEKGTGDNKQPTNHSPSPSKPGKQGTGVDQQHAGHPSPSNKKEHHHLLELAYSRFIPGDIEDCDKSVKRGHYLHESVKNLKKFGIDFQPSSTNALTDVKFVSSFFSGTLKIPPLTIDKNTETLLLNLVAYESSSLPHEIQWITSYLCFMDSLINDAEDVKVLRSKGIIYNYLRSDEEVAELFNNTTKSLEADARAYKYNEAKRGIKEQCENPVSKWIAEVQQKYFSSPWAVFGLIAASLGLFMTGVNVFHTIWPNN